MIARITNYTDKENKVIDWGIASFNLVTLDKIEENDDYVFSCSRKVLEEMLNEFYLLLEKYPNALENKTILENYEKLIKYAKKHSTTVSSCYSYCDRKEICYNQVYSYGIRIVPTNIDTSIKITRYASFDDSFVFGKDELNLKLIDKELNYTGMIISDDTSNTILDREALTYIKPKILTKHL